MEKGSLTGNPKNYPIILRSPNDTISLVCNFRNRCLQRDRMAWEEQGPAERHRGWAVQERQQRPLERNVQRLPRRRRRRREEGQESERINLSNSIGALQGKFFSARFELTTSKLWVFCCDHLFSSVTF